MKKGWTNYLYLITLLFFTLGFFNIIFAWLGFACMIIPFVMLGKTGKKVWCQSYCPRAGLFTKLFGGRQSKGRIAPKWLMSENARMFMLAYFALNLFILFMSAIMVFKGRIDAIERVRFLIAFQLPWNMPQLLNIDALPNWAVHLSFRIYSMMFTTTAIGLLLGWLYKPRTWCGICPVNTVSDMALKRKRCKNA